MTDRYENMKIDEAVSILRAHNAPLSAHAENETTGNNEDERNH